MSTATDRYSAAARRLCEHLGTAVQLPISVKLWDGSRVPLGPVGDSPLALAISDPGVVGSLLRRPTLENLARHYACGNIDVEGGDLIEFGDAVRSTNAKARLKSISKFYLARQLWPFLFARSPKPKPEHGFDGDELGRKIRTGENRDYIDFHYNVSNEFYELFLDKEMLYTCAYYKDPNNTLEQAQLDKMEMICRKLRLKAGESMLDIGCGWGGLTCYAAKRYAVNVTALTLSEAQKEYVEAKVKRLGLENRVHIVLCDYAQYEGQFDKIAAVGMIEHVGIDNMKGYIKKLHSLLRDRGLLLVQGITRGAKLDPRKFRKVRADRRWLAKYIFPGGELDHVGHWIDVMEGTKFQVHDAENWREHYVLTCREWTRRLCARREEAIKLVGAERYRLWAAYLAGCSYAFKDGSARVFQVLASKHVAKGATEVPFTRADLYAA
jgi:cyclopropane-fatty-acyl-phospholipid synthase